MQDDYNPHNYIMPGEFTYNHNNEVYKSEFNITRFPEKSSEPIDFIKLHLNRAIGIDQYQDIQKQFDDAFLELCKVTNHKFLSSLRDSIAKTRYKAGFKPLFWMETK